MDVTKVGWSKTIRRLVGAASQLEDGECRRSAGKLKSQHGKSIDLKDECAGCVEHVVKKKN